MTLRLGSFYRRQPASGSLQLLLSEYSKPNMDNIVGLNLQWDMRLPNCSECQRLEADVTAVLEELRELTTAQLAAFRAGDHSEFMNLDRKLELAVGEKERSVGAQRQHQNEHEHLASG